MVSCTPLFDFLQMFQLSVVGSLPCSDSTMLVSYKNRRISFEVLVSNTLENAYNTRVLATYSKNLFYASITPPVSFE